MFLFIPANFRNLWAYYQLTNADGQTLSVGIVKFTELTQINNSIPEAGVYLSLIDTDDDRLKLANRAMMDAPQRGRPELQWMIRDIIVGWQKEGNRARVVRCVETGKTYQSASLTASINRLSYSQLINHLNGKVGFKSVKGKKYEWA